MAMIAGPKEPLSEKDERIRQLEAMLASVCRQVRASVLSKQEEPALKIVIEQAEWTVKQGER